MKLTKKARRELEAVLRNAERAWEYVHRDDVAVCRRDNVASTTLHYSRADGKALKEVSREYGSDLCGLDTAIGKLRDFLEAN